MISMKNICKSFDGKSILTDFSLDIRESEFVAITGASGSGKTTLLNLIGLLDKPESGYIEIKGIKNPSRKDIVHLWRYHLGFLFQNFVLMNNETVKNNLLISKKYSGNFTEEKMIITLEKVGLDKTFLDKKIYQLSGGEQQRISLARVILKPCSIILADEPTGNLDKDNKESVMNLLQDLRTEGRTILCVTHDPDVANQSDRVITMSRDMRIGLDLKNEIRVT